MLFNFSAMLEQIKFLENIIGFSESCLFFHRLAEMENTNGSYLNDSISPNESM